MNKYLDYVERVDGYRTLKAQYDWMNAHKEGEEESEAEELTVNDEMENWNMGDDLDEFVKDEGEGDVTNLVNDKVTRMREELKVPKDVIKKQKMKNMRAWLKTWRKKSR